MGDMIDKPNQVEGNTKSIPGLQILPVKTILTPIKTTVQREFYFLNNPVFCKGYEIHIGETISNQNSPLCNYTENSIKKEEGYFLNPKT
jgi:adenosylcobyric acid synthase